MTEQERDLVCKLAEAAWARNESLATAIMIKLMIIAIREKRGLTSTE